MRPLFAERRPPGSMAGAGHESLLARFYGDPTSLDTVPAPNMEWWWQAIDFEAGNTQVSVISNVQVFAVPLLGWVAQGTVAVRLLPSKPGGTGTSLEVHAAGDLDPGPRAGFVAPGLRLGFLDPHTYRITVASSELQLELESSFGNAAWLGDPDGEAGWYDLNPKGLIPLWASYRSHFGHVRGAFTVNGERYEAQGAAVRFDHQSLHFSPRDVRAFSIPVMAEGLLLRPRWSWYHAKLEREDGDSVNLMLCEVTNGHTGAVMKRAAALSDDEGNTALVRSESIQLSLPPRERARPSLRGRVKANSTLRARFEVVAHEGRLAPHWEGSYDLTFAATLDQDWTVRYPIVGRLRYEAQEVPIGVEGSLGVVNRDRVDCGAHDRGGARGSHVALRGRGTQEVLDMLSSVTIER
jgi:hypothetical protein